MRITMMIISNNHKFKGRKEGPDELWPVNLIPIFGKILDVQ